MIKHNQNGEVNGVVISLIFAVALLFITLGVAGWAISGRQDYKNNVDQKIGVAVKKAIIAEDIAKDKQFAEQYKNPLQRYNGPEAYGSVVFDYPKTWSGYVDDSGSGNSLVNGYFSPAIVPPISNASSTYALRVQVNSGSYDQVLKSYSTLQKTGKVTISAYALPKLPNIVGARVVGIAQNKKSIDMVILPLRDKTVQIWTEGGQYSSDFNTNILPNFSFSP